MQHYNSCASTRGFFRSLWQIFEHRGRSHITTSVMGGGEVPDAVGKWSHFFVENWMRWRFIKISFNFEWIISFACVHIHVITNTLPNAHFCRWLNNMSKGRGRGVNIEMKAILTFSSFNIQLKCASIEGFPLSRNSSLLNLLLLKLSLISKISSSMKETSWTSFQWENGIFIRTALNLM